jgi:hypothetical protein
MANANNTNYTNPLSEVLHNYDDDSNDSQLDEEEDQEPQAKSAFTKQDLLQSIKLKNFPKLDLK